MSFDAGKRAPSLSNHTWGLCRSADRVWAHVVGLAPDQANGRLLMVWQAYIDESEKDGLLVLAGYIAPASAWAQFSIEWQPLLRRFGILDKTNTYSFHMTEMAFNADRIENAQVFYRVIERYVSGLVSVALRIDDLNRAINRVLLIGPDGMAYRVPEVPLLTRPYVMAFRQLLGLVGMFPRLGGVAERIIPVNQKIDFIFDDRGEKRAILEAWDIFSVMQPDVRSIFGATPRFEDDKEFLPLQAADMLAWFVRASYGSYNLERNGVIVFPWQSQKDVFGVHGSIHEDQITQQLMLDSINGSRGRVDAIDRAGVIESMRSQD